MRKIGKKSKSIFSSQKNIMQYIFKELSLILSNNILKSLSEKVQKMFSKFKTFYIFIEIAKE